jgi:hypothetical protein
MASSGAKLKKFLLRYFPPGIILQYERDGQMKQKPIDLLDLTPDTDVEARWAPPLSRPCTCLCRQPALSTADIQLGVQERGRVGVPCSACWAANRTADLRARRRTLGSARDLVLSLRRCPYAGATVTDHPSGAAHQ